MTVPYDSCLCDPCQHNLEETSCPLQGFNQVVALMTLKLDTNFNQRLNYKSVEELFSIDKIFEKLITLNDSLCKEFVQGSNCIYILTTKSDHLKFYTIQQLASYTA